jgi:hypothetical protein
MQGAETQPIAAPRAVKSQRADGVLASEEAADSATYEALGDDVKRDTNSPSPDLFKEGVVGLADTKLNVNPSQRAVTTPTAVVSGKPATDRTPLLAAASAAAAVASAVDVGQKKPYDTKILIKLGDDTSLAIQEYEMHGAGKGSRLIVVHVVALSLASASLPLYFDGNKDEDITALLSSLVSNFIINYFSGVAAGMTDFSKFSKPRIVASIFAALIVTFGSFAAEYYLGSKVLWKALAVYGGNLGLNAFGLLSVDFVEVFSTVLMPLVAPSRRLWDLCRERCGQGNVVAREKALEDTREAFIKAVENLRSTISIGTKISFATAAKDAPATQKLIDKLVAMAYFLPTTDDSKPEITKGWRSWLLSNMDYLLREAFGYAGGWMVLGSSVSQGCVAGAALSDIPINGSQLSPKTGQGVGHLFELPLYMLSFLGGYRFGHSIYDNSIGRVMKWCLSQPQSQDISSRLHKIYSLFPLIGYLIAGRSYNTAIKLLAEFCPEEIVNEPTKADALYLTIVFNGYWVMVAFAEAMAWCDLHYGEPSVRQARMTDEQLKGIIDNLKQISKKELQAVATELATKESLPANLATSPAYSDPNFKNKLGNFLTDLKKEPKCNKEDIEKIEKLVAVVLDPKSRVPAQLSDSKSDQVVVTNPLLDKFIGKTRVEHLKGLAVLGSSAPSQHVPPAGEDEKQPEDSAIKKSNEYQALPDDAPRQSRCSNWSCTIM